MKDGIDIEIVDQMIIVGVNNKELTGICIDRRKNEELDGGETIVLVVKDNDGKYKTLFIDYNKIAYIARLATHEEKEKHDTIHKKR